MEPQLQKPKRRIKKWLIGGVIGLALMGFIGYFSDSSNVDTKKVENLQGSQVQATVAPLETNTEPVPAADFPNGSIITAQTPTPSPTPTPKPTKTTNPTSKPPVSTPKPTNNTPSAQKQTIITTNIAGEDKNCKDFKTQAEAQTYFNSKGGSASNNVDDLDRDHDGEACESLP
jgi:hypothetical protein